MKKSKVYLQQMHQVGRQADGSAAGFNAGFQAADGEGFLKEGALVMIPIADVSELQLGKTYEIEIRPTK
jgi:hypothetical protein